MINFCFLEAQEKKLQFKFTWMYGKKKNETCVPHLIDFNRFYHNSRIFVKVPSESLKRNTSFLLASLKFRLVTYMSHW